MQRYILFLFFIALLSNLESYSQSPNSEMVSEELILKGYFESLFTRDSVRYIRTDEEKNRINDSIISSFKKILVDEESFLYPFDSLKKTGRLRSENNLMRIITWNTRFKDGSYKYYGFIQHKNNKKNKIETWLLTDKSDSVLNPENTILSYYNWYGALYYEMHSYSEKKKDYYILFGWDGNNNYTNKKIIEILTFNNTGKPIFGKSVFKTEKKLQKRVIFEHTIKSSMSCKYNKSMNAIVFDHLSPLKPSQTGQFQFYGPDGSFDGYKLNKGKWIYVPDINVTNPKPSRKEDKSKNKN